ncbi:MAG: carbohydrate kinase family protein [Chloroflexota bacterium]
MTKILIIGSASLDTLHISGQTHHTVGGAGLYTALAVAKAGCSATLLAPMPEPMPEPLQLAANQISWIGPLIAPDQLAQLEIAHHGDGKATLIGAAWGATETLSSQALPTDLSGYFCVHVAALPTAHAQLEFVQACRQRNASRISVGTYAKIAFGETDTVRQLLERTDFFFMNENEARGLFGELNDLRGPDGSMWFITMGKEGAWLLRGSEQIKVESPAVTEVDPTGAGDTFCGVTLAGLANGMALREAMLNGCSLAAQTIQGIGPSRLY